MVKVKKMNIKGSKRIIVTYKGNSIRLLLVFLQEICRPQGNGKIDLKC